MSDYNKSIHNNPDAQAWAKFFISTVQEQSWRLEDIDENLMTGWFANAMMAMHDHVKKEWVELTDEEIHKIVYEQMEGQHPAAGFRVANCIEAKATEKNHGRI